MNKCICIKDVLDEKKVIIFAKNQSFSFIKGSVVGSGPNGPTSYDSYRINPENYDLPISEYTFRNHFELIEEHREKQLESLGL